MKKTKERGMDFHVNLYGCGQMAQAIFRGLAKDPKGPRNFTLHTYTPSYTKAFELAQHLGGKAYRDLNQLPSSPYHFLALKPQQFGDLSQNLAPLLSPKAIAVSIMAGIGLGTIKESLGLEKAIRVMPNTPCRVGRGVSLMVCSPEVTERERDQMASLFKGVSVVMACQNEDQLDRAMAVSGCGPAYLFEKASILEDYLQTHGFSPESSATIVRELFMGSSLLLSESDESPSTLCRRVASKGGATEKALHLLKEKDLKEIMNLAMDRAYERAKELAKGQ
ncbi:MAG: pyrroline-5-carboxylate reductase [Bacteriovoracales bacterium]|nr:pyrroline-5-carboxylate reductase [Bacteriovoracales bacterium]